MGGRRKSNKMQKKEKPIQIKTVFDCGICGYKNCVLVKIKKLIKRAELICDKCKITFVTNIRGMDEPIDVYHMWLKQLKQKNQVVTQQENRFEDQISQSEVQDVEQLLKQDNSEDSLEEQDQKIKKLKMEDIDEMDEPDISEDSLVKQESEISDSIDSVLSDEEFDEPRKKVKA